ncbi:MAG TPA: LssY C-terminal domain-containing protein [Candidatus Bathyarchaeia archaeon]|nr:LssY C-terminal domain-containing protein [Candidatus Bathyarchaeia archaeon]
MRSIRWRNARSFLWTGLAILVVPAGSGCVSYRPRPAHEVAFTSHAQTKTDGDLRVTVAVLDEQETAAVFGVPLYRRGIQPVWLEIENQGDDPYVLSKPSLDAQYYSPLEAAYVNHFRATRWLPDVGPLSLLFLPALIPGGIEQLSAAVANRQMDLDFDEKGFGNGIVPAGETRSGFVFTTLDEGTKRVPVVLYGTGEQRRLTFLVRVPGARLDHHRVDFAGLYREDEVAEVDGEGLRSALAQLPCCTTSRDGRTQGDPLNLVIVGDFDDVLHAFRHARWDETEYVHARSAWRTIASFLFGKRYRTSPVSDLYVFGRRQDVAFQKVRNTVDDRHHFRLWLAPLRFDGRPVWIGQASRDVGVRFTLKTSTLTTHAIDADVDDARDYVLGDLVERQRVGRLGYAGGVGTAAKSAPRTNLTGDPYFTDGFRGVVVLAEPPARLEVFDWDYRPLRGAAGAAGAPAVARDGSSPSDDDLIER